MIELTIKLDDSGNVQAGWSEGANAIQLMGMLKIAEKMILDIQLKPQTQSPLISARPGLSLT